MPTGNSLSETRLKVFVSLVIPVIPQESSDVSLLALSLTTRIPSNPCDTHRYPKLLGVPPPLPMAVHVASIKSHNSRTTIQVQFFLFLKLLY